MKAYITKYALSIGILVSEGEVVDRFWNKELFRVHGSGNLYFNDSGKKEWCETEKEAFEIAEQMRKESINNLEQKIARLKVAKIKLAGKQSQEDSDDRSKSKG